MLRSEALGLILRLACDLPTMESMLETSYVLFSSAWGQMERQSNGENEKCIFGSHTAPTLCQVLPNAGVEYILYIAIRLRLSMA